MKVKFIIVFLFFTISLFGQKQVFTLQECIDSALTNNIQFLNKKLTVAGNDLNLKQSKYSRVPTLNGNIGEGASQGRNFGSTVSGGLNVTDYNTSLGLSTSVTLFNSFKINNTIRQNEDITKASQYDVEALKNTIITNIINAYLQVLYAYENKSIAEEQVKSSASQVVFTQNQLNAGKVAEPSLLQIKSQHANDILSLVNAKSSIMINKITLFQLMQIPADDSIDFMKMNIDSILLANSKLGDPNSRSDIYSGALNVLPEIKSSQLGINSAQYGLKVAKADRYPKLSFSAGISTNYYSLYKLYSDNFIATNIPIGYLQGSPSQKVFSLTSETINYPFGQQLSDNLLKSAMLTLTIPIFNGYTVENNIRHQKLNINSARLNDQTTKNAVRMEIEQAYTQYMTARDQFNASSEQLQYEEKTYHSVTARFKLGMATPTDLQVEKANYVHSEVNLLESKYQLLYALKLLEYFQTGIIKF